MSSKLMTKVSDDGPAETPLVSVVIPVFNQGKDLARCLAALERQTYSQDHLEVVVVDNGSREAIGEVVTRFPFARCVRELKPGSYAARNRGIEASRGELIGFTDADCVPSPTWVEHGVRAVQRLPGLGMVGGRIDLTIQDPEKPSAAELYECVFGFPQEDFIRWGFAATANLFTSRAAVQKVGPFDDRLFSGGDMEWGQRLRSLGLAQAYAADVTVFHAARRTVGELCRKVLRVAAGNQQLADQRGDGTMGLLVYAWRQLIEVRRIRATLSHERLTGLGRMVRFAAVVWLVDLLRTVERYRVHYGGRTRRT
jgi:GT2 family glycosyltransferase